MVSKSMRSASAVLAICSMLVVAGCALPLHMDEVPKSGRYTIVTRDTGELIFSFAGKVSFEQMVVKADHGVSEAMRDSIRTMIEDGYEYEFVPVDVDLEYERPDYATGYVGSYFVTAIPSREFDLQEVSLKQKLMKLGQEYQLDFIIVVSEWVLQDFLNGTGIPMVGTGVLFRDAFGKNTIDAYAAFSIELFDISTGRSVFQTGLAGNKLDELRWSELTSRDPVTILSTEAFVNDIEESVPPADLKRTLCRMGLIPIPRDVGGPNNWIRCDTAFFYKPRR